MPYIFIADKEQDVDLPILSRATSIVAVTQANVSTVPSVNTSLEHAVIVENTLAEVMNCDDHVIRPSITVQCLTVDQQISEDDDGDVPEILFTEITPFCDELRMVNTPIYDKIYYTHTHTHT